MDLNEKNTNLFLLALTPLGLGCLLWAAVGLTPQAIDPRALVIGVLAVFCGCFFQVRIPRTKYWLTLADGLILVSVVLFGGEIAILIAVAEAACSSIINTSRDQIARKRTILLNTMSAGIAVLVAVKGAHFVFGSKDIILQRGDLVSVIWMLVFMAGTMFVINTSTAALFSSLLSGGRFVTAWTQSVFYSVLIYTSGVFFAVSLFKALEQLNTYLLAAIIVFFGLAYYLFRRGVDEVRSTIANTSRTERERAETAESEIQRLRTYVDELEETGAALRESHERFRHAAYHDALTGLPNRNFFIDTLKGLLNETRLNSETNFAVLYLDLRSFKTINDSLGHSLGDRLIKNVAKRLVSMVREEDMVARFSGDKFGIILCDLLSKEEATSFADRLAKRLGEPYTLDGRQVFTSAKIGIAYGNSNYPEAEDILRDADIAMYYAKENDDNYVIFDQRMHTRAVTRLQLETDLRFAIERNEFELFYQPIITLSDSTLKGFEALVRWRHPQRGLVPPNEFIPISESTGLIIPMTVQILHSACLQIVRWQKLSPTGRPLSVAVNLSGKHFGHPALVEQITTVVKETGIDPSCLKLELTESAVMENAETAILMLKQIKETGVQISIDDFGTGYSSLSYLHRFPIDQLKVDRSFVSAMEENTENGEIVRTVIALAKALDLKVVAEGIESVHQFHQLRILGCEYGQGYLFSKPLPVQDIERLLADKNRWQDILPTASMLQAQSREASRLRLA